MKIKFSFFAIVTMFLFSIPLYAGEEKYLDFYEEEIRLFGVSDAQNHIDFELEKRLDVNYYFVDNEKNKTPGFAYDFADKVNGDFCVTYRPSVSNNAKKFGFMTNLWGDYYKADGSFILKLYIKVQDAPQSSSSWKVVLIDSKRNHAGTVLENVNTQGQWREFSVPLKRIEKTSDFDMTSIRMCEFEAGEFPQKAIVKFDKVRFENDQGTVWGITDKSMAQRLAEQKTTREMRINRAYEDLALDAPYPLAKAFAMMYLNKNIKEANEILIEEIQISRNNVADHWSLFRTPIYCRFYYWFSNRAGKFKGRISEEAEKLLLGVLWERTETKNDIHWARQSTWNLDGSENHDLNSKACNLVTSRIFMNEPEYKDRIYPDYGFGGAYHYHHAGYYGKGIDPDLRHGGGRANLKDGKEYTAKDHYEAWVKYMKEYFSERAKYGFFGENSSPTYSKHIMNFIDLIYSHSGDKELTGRVENFIDLYWANWVQTGIAGVSGGPKTRHKGGPDNYDSNKALIGFHLGGVAAGGVWSYWNIITDYKLPEVIQMMALDREGMKEFIYQSRGIGEADITKFNDLGTERTLVYKPQSRFLKYTYVTQNYTIGTQMDHPLSVYTHSAMKDRWQGMTVAEHGNLSVAPIDLPLEPKHWTEMGELKKRGLESRSLQHKNTLIVQRSKRYLTINPAWFPLIEQWGETGVYVGRSWDERVEKNGWLFLRKSDVYAAVRVVLWDEEFEREKLNKIDPLRDEDSLTSTEDDPKVKLSENCTDWDAKNEMLVLKDRYAPIIIQAGNKKEFGSFEDFMQAVLKAPLELYRTVAPGYHIVVFTPPGNNSPEIVFNAANNEIPVIDGHRINYEYPMTFESPYIKSKYGSGLIKIEYDGKKLELDFSD